MARIYSYPRVDTSVTAVVHSTDFPEAPDTTVLFVPFVSEKGPFNKIVKIHSLEEFQSTFGEIKHYYERIGKDTAFMIMNWLTAGGTIYAVRMSGLKGSAKKAILSDKESQATISLTSKEEGDYINDFSVSFTVTDDNTKGEYKFSFFVKNPAKNTIERFAVLCEKPKADSSTSTEVSITNSEYFGTLEVKPSFNLGNGNGTCSYTEQKGTDGLTDEFDAILNDFWATDMPTDTHSIVEKRAKDIIANPLETPIDLIMDAGYSDDVKKKIARFVAPRNEGDDVVRDDIRAIIQLEMGDKELSTLGSFKEEFSDFPENANVFYYWQDQGFRINDSIFSNDEISVKPSYFLSSLIPANDISIGIQYPVAGTRRGELSGLIALDKNPMPNEKEKLFEDHINYVEKDSRGAYFMNQRTGENVGTNKHTALAFINNSRVICRMVHEIEKLGRDYLFEFNDAMTLANMRSVLNKYVSNWIANRALSYGAVEVAPSTTSNEAVNVTLNIKFTGTIEVISVDIVIE